MRKFAEIVGSAMMIAAGLSSTAVPSVAQAPGSGLVAIKIKVTDVERSIRFYSVLGMTPGTKYNDHEWELRWPSGFRGSGVILVTDNQGRSGLIQGGGFLMVSVPDVPATAERLRAAGFAVEGRSISLPQATIMVVKDADGNRVELVGGPYRKPGSTNSTLKR